MRYILLVMALLKACDVINNSRHLVHHLGFYQELEISLRLREIVICALYMKNNTSIKPLHDFSHKIYFYC